MIDCRRSSCGPAATHNLVTVRSSRLRQVVVEVAFLLNGELQLTQRATETALCLCRCALGPPCLKR